MALKDNGFEFWRPGQALVMLQILDKDEAGVIYHEQYYNPTGEEIANAARKYGLNPEVVLELVYSQDSAHTLFIDIPKYKEGNPGAVAESVNG